MRSLFLLLASEVGIKSDRIRRHKGVDDMPPSDAVLAFVKRMTSVAGMWIEVADFEKRFGFRPEKFAVIQSCCEACMLACVGARAENLVDLRANIIARQKIGDGYKPALLRFVEAWIHHFDDLAGFLMMESDRLAHQLRAVRDAEYEMRRKRNERHRRRTGRDQKLPRRVLELNDDGIPVPRALKRTASQGGGGGGSRQPEPPRPVSLYVPPPPAPSPPVTPVNQDRVDDWRQQLVERYSVDETPVDVQLDGREEDSGQWVDEVGSYYFSNDGRDRGKGKEKATDPIDNSGEYTGARSNWTTVTPAGRVHPAFRTQGTPSINRSASPAPSKKKPSGAEKLHALFRSSSTSTQRFPASWRPPTPGRSTTTPQSRGPQVDRTSSTANLLNPPETASLWTEGTLHTSGGRTDLGLAPPMPEDDLLSNLVRDGGRVRSVEPARQVHEETLRILEGRGTPQRPASSGWLGRPQSWSSSVYSTDEQQQQEAPAVAQERPPSRATEDTEWGAFVGHHHGRK
jgi:hypothetical protein